MLLSYQSSHLISDIRCAVFWCERYWRVPLQWYRFVIFSLISCKCVLFKNLVSFSFSVLCIILICKNEYNTVSFYQKQFILWFTQNVAILREREHTTFYGSHANNLRIHLILWVLQDLVLPHASVLILDFIFLLVLWIAEQNTAKMKFPGQSLKSRTVLRKELHLWVWKYFFEFHHVKNE